MSAFNRLLVSTLPLVPKAIVGRVASRYVAGETLDDAVAAVRNLSAQGAMSTIDVLGEEVSEREKALAAVEEYVHVFDAIDKHQLDSNVSIKLTLLGLKIDEGFCRDNVDRIAQVASKYGNFVRIDMEDHTTTDATLALWRALRPRNAGRGDSGVVIQAALKRSPADVEALIAEGARIRLCKGAYVEPASVAHPAKADVDAAYATLMERLLREAPFPALATHDERLIARAIELARDAGIGPDRFEFQMLYGVRRDLQERLVRAGFGVRVYVPFGREWYPYFMRRLAERPANVAFILRSLLREGRGRGS